MLGSLPLPGYYSYCLASGKVAGGGCQGESDSLLGSGKPGGSLKASPVENDGCPSLILPQAVFFPFLQGMTQSEANLLNLYILCSRRLFHSVAQSPCDSTFSSCDEGAPISARNDCMAHVLVNVHHAWRMGEGTDF